MVSKALGVTFSTTTVLMSISYYYGPSFIPTGVVSPIHRKFVEGVMAIKFQYFNNWAVQFHQCVLPLSVQSKSVCLVPAPFLIIRFIRVDKYDP